MAVENHETHARTIKISGGIRHCSSRPDFKKSLIAQDGWTADGRKVIVEVEFTMSDQCRYDQSLTDEECRQCFRRGEGEAYTTRING